MRHAIFLLAGLVVVSGCSPADRNRVSETPPTPPTVSYRVTGNDISQTNVIATQYCQRYGTGAQYQGLQSTTSGNVAVYSCSGPAAVSGSSVAPAPYGYPQNTYPQSADGGPPVDTLQCADMMHQDRPGGSDYRGPPVAGCSQTR
jgi:hypothetical protein